MVAVIRRSMLVLVVMGGVLGAVILMPALGQSTRCDGQSAGQVTNVDEAKVGAKGDDLIQTTAQEPTGVGQGGPDCLVGANGVDNTLVGGDGKDTMRSGAGEDELTGGADADTINAGAGNDAVDGGAGADMIDGGTGNDTLTGGAGSDTLKGGDDDDQLAGGAGKGNVLEGGAGDDVIQPSGLRDVVEGGSGNDTIVSSGLGVTVRSGPDGSFIDVANQSVQDWVTCGSPKDRVLANYGDTVTACPTASVTYIRKPG